MLHAIRVTKLNFMRSRNSPFHFVCPHPVAGLVYGGFGRVCNRCWELILQVGTSNVAVQPEGGTEPIAGSITRLGVQDPKFSFRKR